MALIFLEGTGRMFELGNRTLLRSCAREIEQIFRFDAPRMNVEWYSATETIERVAWDVDDEFPMNEFVKGGRLNIELMLSFVGKSNDAVLLVTDGCWSAITVHAIENALRENPQLEFYVMVMGTDKSAAAFRVNRSGKRIVYSGDEILELMPRLIQGDDRG
jgi:sulfur transfer complex TusBCD TusB component (DsrH family)